MEKYLIKNEEDFIYRVGSYDNDIVFDQEEEPETYPCLLIVIAEDTNYNEINPCIGFFIYQKDFEK